MRTIAIRQRPVDRGGVATARAPQSVFALTIAGAWLVAVVAQATGNASLLHHHALIEGGSPLWVALLLFLVGWQVMIMAMELPASLPAIRAFQAGPHMRSGPRHDVAGFLVAYAVVWTAFGVLAFMCDVVIHEVVDLSPWIATRPWLIEAGVVALAGAYQFVPNKRQALAACRHPIDPAATASRPGSSAVRLGLLHGFACVGSSWALMLVMFAAGFANLWWMAALTGLMAYETMGRHGQRAATAAGVVLAALAVLIAASRSGAM